MGPRYVIKNLNYVDIGKPRIDVSKSGIVSLATRIKPLTFTAKSRQTLYSFVLN